VVSINIDIKTRVLPADHRAYIVRPGAGYRLYDDVATKSAILYDVPALDIPQGTSFAEIPDIAAQLQRGQALKWWFRIGRFAGEPYPSMDLQDYPYPTTSTDRRSLSQLLSIGAAYFDRSRPGDLVIVPPLRFSDSVMVGEIVGRDNYIGTSIYGELPVVGRHVRWLTQIPKNNVPSRVIEISQKPNSFVQLERSSATWFYDRTYRSYMLDGRYQCELKIEADVFGSTDDAKLSAFLNFVVANFVASERRTVFKTIEESIFSQLGEYEPSKRISINSPGDIVVHAFKITPILFVVLLGLSGCTPAEVHAAINDNTVTIGNSAAGPGDPCAAEVYQSTLQWLTFVGADHWSRACQIAAQAVHSAHVSLPAEVTVVP
jgi:hypothetical protein